MIRIGVFAGPGRTSNLEPVTIKITTSESDYLNTNRAIQEGKHVTNKKDEQSS